VGVWIELGLFLAVIGVGLWQVHDSNVALRKSRQKREAEEAAKKAEK